MYLKKFIVREKMCSRFLTTFKNSVIQTTYDANFRIFWKAPKGKKKKPKAGNYKITDPKVFFEKLWNNECDVPLVAANRVFFRAIKDST